MSEKLNIPWTLQTLETNRHGFKDWKTYAIRDARNICLAVVGDVDHATAPINEDLARLMLAAPHLLAACKAALAQFNDQMFIWGKDDDEKVCHMTRDLAGAIAKAERVSA